MTIDTASICNTMRRALKDALRGVPAQYYSMQEKRDSMRIGRTLWEETVIDIVPQNDESAPVTVIYIDGNPLVNVEIGANTGFELPVDEDWGPFGPTLEENIREMMAAAIYGGVYERAINVKKRQMTIESQLRTPSGRVAEMCRSSFYRDVTKAAKQYPREYAPYISE